MSLRVLLDHVQGRQARLLEFPDPAGLELVDRYRIQVVELAAAVAHRRHEVGGLENIDVLADRLPAHVEPVAELTQSQPGPLMKHVEQAPPAGGRPAL